MSHSEPEDEGIFDPELLKEFERELEQEAVIDAETRRRSDAWQEQWPNHCAACGGWGGSSYQQAHPYGSGVAHETLYDICEAIDYDVCHRCGQVGLSEDGEGPCSNCGWNYDDGDPLA